MRAREGVACLGEYLSRWYCHRSQYIAACIVKRLTGSRLHENGQLLQHGRRLSHLLGRFQSWLRPVWSMVSINVCIDLRLREEGAGVGVGGGDGTLEAKGRSEGRRGKKQLADISRDYTGADVSCTPLLNLPLLDGPPKAQRNRLLT